MIQPQPEHISLSDFLAWEETQEHKHELLDGEILAFSGGSFDHNDIALNVCALLRERIAPPCRAHNSDTIIETRASKGESGLRADASVSCSSEDAGRAKYMRHPRIIVEVRSALERRCEVGEQALRVSRHDLDRADCHHRIRDAFGAIVRARRRMAVARRAYSRG